MEMHRLTIPGCIQVHKWNIAAYIYFVVDGLMVNVGKYTSPVGAPCFIPEVQ